MPYSIHCRIWFAIEMAQSYLAYHRGELLESVNHENNARRYEMELQRMEILK